MSGRWRDRLRTRSEQVRVRAEDARTAAAERLEAARTGFGPVDALVRAWERDSEVGGGLMAGALAFRLFLFLVPLVLVVVTAIGATAEVAAASPTDLARDAGISGVLAKAVVDVDSAGSGQRWVLLVLSLYVLVSTARTVVASLVAVHVLVWRLPKVKIKRLKPALLLIGFVVLASFASNYLGRLREAAPAPGLALTLAWVLLPLVAWWWTSLQLPHGDAPPWALLPGAVVFAVGMQLLHLFTVYYVAQSAVSKSERYGVAGIALAVLLWTYLAGRLITSTAVVNATLWRRFTERAEAASATGSSPAAATSTPADPSATTTQEPDGPAAGEPGLTAWIRSAAGLLR